MMVQTVTEADLAERLLRALMALTVRHRRVLERQTDIFHGAGTGQEVEALENKPHRAVPHGGQFITIQPRDVVTREQVAAAGGPI